ncbi:MAG: ABC transporter ATP-binding protein [Candidatus Dormibacteria bacterium]
MSDTAITVTGVSKRFRIPLDRSSTLKYRLTHLRSSSRYRDLLAVNDLTFDVPQGQFLGITGPNGCGKSTLLKILSRIYTPDTGRVRVEGRVSPFLELGVGFNPELSARENIFLGGAVLGLTRKQLAARVPRVLEFAELEEFADQKLKNFSSGMGVRLAFAVAIQADADILLMDEVLAVGDARFQEKCFDVFAEYKRQNRTIVLVSHDLGSLNLYCDRVLLLQNGHLIADGPADEVTSQYRRIVGAMSDDGAAPGAAPDSSIAGSARWGSREVEITAVRITDDRGRPHAVFATGGFMRVELDYLVNAPAQDYVFGLGIKRADGVSLAGPNTKTGGHRMSPAAPGTRGTISYTVDSIELLAASYKVTAAVYNSYLNHAYDHIEDAVTFRVLDEKGRLGMVELRGEWEESRQSA